MVKSMRKIVALLLILCILSVGTAAFALEETPSPTPPPTPTPAPSTAPSPSQGQEGEAQEQDMSQPFAVDATSAVLMDAASGQVIYAHNADKEVPMTTLAKAMSLLIIAEELEAGRISEDAQVTISKAASEIGGATAFLELGKQYTIGELMRCVAMSSANDACLALAEQICGSQDVFVQQMNKRAKEMGLEHTTFSSATGRSEQGNTSSARDLAEVSRQVVRHENILEYSKTWMSTLQHAGGRTTELTNPNRLVRSFDGCDGLQTGSSAEAKYCGVITAQRDGLRLIAVVMGTENTQVRSEQAKKLLDYGFYSYASLRVARAGEVVKRDVSVRGGAGLSVQLTVQEDLNLLVPKGQEAGVKKEVHIPEQLSAPLSAGQAVGELCAVREGTVLGRVPVVVRQDVREADLWGSIAAFFRQWVYAEQ
ncbi:D-alanyl-D-alanine carboxypeptidase DacF [Bacteroidia bacterium]|nr:D-alanyl-D-alanine carboxypeptidase DacF [Bacteroidia bacterium]